MKFSSRPEVNEFSDSKPSVRHQVSPVRIRFGGFLIVNMDKKPIVLERNGNFYPVSRVSRNFFPSSPYSAMNRSYGVFPLRVSCG